MKLRFVTLLAVAAPIVALLTACPSVQTSSGGGTPPPSASCTAAVTLPYTISTATTLKAGCYLAPGDVNVDAPLTLDPGVTIQFPQDATMTVEQGTGTVGSLYAVGTSASGGAIVLEGVQDTAGYWGGVTFYTNSQQNDLEYVHVRDAGDSNTSSDASVWVESGIPFTMKHSTLSYSGINGLDFDAGAQANQITLQANTYDHIAVYPVSLGADAAGALDPASVYTNDPGNAVEVFGGTVSESQTWHHLGVPYLDDNGDVSVDAVLTVAAGTTVQFSKDYGLTIDNGSIPNPGGAIPYGLVAVGGSAAGQEITFEGAVTKRTPGYWSGIVDYGAGTDLEHVVVRDAGGTNGGQGADVWVESGIPFTMKDSILSYSLTEGLAFDASAAASQITLQANTYDHIATFPVSLTANAAGALDAASTYTNNTDNVVQVYGGTVSANQTWQGLSVPFYLDQDADIAAALVMAPGATVQFGQDNSLTVDASPAGSLTAVGQAADHITFTGKVSGTPGYWGSITFDSNDPNNQLSYVDISEGGSQASAETAEVYVLNGGTVTLDNTTISDSPVYGVCWDGGTSQPSLTTVTFANTGATSPATNYCAP
jgi:hypothetical protein